MPGFSTPHARVPGPAHRVVASVRARLPGARTRARKVVRRARRYGGLALSDAYLRVTGRRDELVPPRRRQLAGWRADAGPMGEWWLEVLCEVAGLRPSTRVLDMGCGPGRIAAPLARYLDAGSYEGFDVDPESIRWGQRVITARHPNFRFRLAEVRNAQYRPDSGAEATSYGFPYPSDDFDLALALSLFTHLRPDETEHYLRETARVLRPGGRLAGTFFLLNDESERALAGRERELRLEAELTDPAGRGYRARSHRVPEHRIAPREADVLEMLDSAGLRLETIRYGRWYDSFPARQDLVVAVR